MLLYHVSLPFGRYTHWKLSQGTFTTASRDRCIGSCVFGVAQVDLSLASYKYPHTWGHSVLPAWELQF